MNASFFGRHTKFALILIIVFCIAGLGYAASRFIGIPLFPYDIGPGLQENDSDNEYRKMLLPEREAPFFTLTPQVKSIFGIIPSEKFILTSKNKVSAAFVEQHIDATVPVSIQEGEGNTVIISPQQEFKHDEMVRIQLDVKGFEYEGHVFDRNYGWSFQTQGKFRVVNHIPADKRTYVPVNTGIDITFSQDDYEDPEKYISVVPAVNYRIERHNETVSLVPLSPLEHGTVYTVTVQKGLRLTSRDDVLSEDTVISFQTEFSSQEQESYFSIDEDFVERVPAERLSFKVFTSGPQLPVKASVYRFASRREFLSSRKKIDEASTNWYMSATRSNDVDVSFLDHISTHDISVETQEQLQYLTLPSPLPGGYYYVTFTTGDQKEYQQVWLQVTDVSGFVSAGTKKTTVWANNLSTHQPASHALVTMSNSSGSYTLNDKGFAVIDTPDVLLHASGGYIIVETGASEIVLPVVSGGGYEKQTSQDYWSYLYHERRFYKTTDTVQFWGVVKHRDTGNVPSSVTVELVDQDILKKVTVTPQSDGTYEGSISFTDIDKGSYTLQVITDGHEVASTYLSIFDYVKPDMTISVSSGRQAMFSDETANMTARVSFFDGTPASYMELMGSKSWYDTDKIDLKADQNGRVQFEFVARGSSVSNPYQSECVVITPRTETESTIEGSTCIDVFYRKLVLTRSSKTEGTTGHIRVGAHEVDLKKYNANPQDGFTGSPVKGQKANIRIVKNWWEKVDAGTYYDFVEKVTRKKYDYKQRQEVVVEQPVQSNDQGEIVFDFPLEKSHSYEATVTTNDSDGNAVDTKEYFSYGYEDYGMNSQADAKPQIELKSKTNIFGLGDMVDVSLMSGSSIYPDTDTNRFLFIVSERGTQEAYLQGSPALSFPFEQKHVPNAALSAVVFTGKAYIIAQSSCRQMWYCGNSSWYYRYYGLPETSIVYDKDLKKLTLTYSFDKDVYRPADDATVTVRVNDHSGQPVSGAQVHIAMVDQALAAIGGAVEPDILPTLYQTVHSGLFYAYQSHRPVVPDEPQAEKGGGGGGDDRGLFKDTALFSSGQTNDEGLAVFKFTLPDNITTWNVYGQAVTSQFDAGHTVGTLVTTKDFFVDSSFISTYLTDDAPMLSGSTFGTGLTKTDRVHLEAAFMKDGNIISSDNTDGTTFTSYGFLFPDLPVGSYTASLEGRSGGNRDKITLPFSVIENRFTLEKDISEFVTAGNAFDAPLDYTIQREKPYRLVVSDQGKGTYYRYLARYCSLSSNRVEKMMAKKVAGDVLAEQFGIDDCVVDTADLASFQGQDGGLGQVKWGGSDLNTTAWAVSVDPSPFDEDKLVSYLESYINNDTYDVGLADTIRAAWGLSSLNKPYLTYLQQSAGKASTFEEKVLVGIALAQNGETETARDMYYNMLADYGWENGYYVRIQSDANPDLEINKTVHDTGMALLLGALVEPSYNKGMYEYIADFRYDAEDIVTDLAGITFIKDHLSELPEGFTSVTYTSNRRTLSHEMKTGGTWGVTVFPDEQDKYKLTIETGKADVTAYFNVGSEGLTSAKKDPNLSLSRRYTNVTGNGEFTPGDIVRVELDFSMSL